MIRVTVELVSARGREHDRLLGRAEICNDGTGTPTLGHYDAKFYGAKKLLETARFEGFKRGQHNVWVLLMGLLVLAFHDRIKT